MEFDGYLKFVLALAFVLGLIGVLAVILRRFGPGAVAMVPRRKGMARRLQVIEVATIDPRRRLVLVRRDDKEHLILLGANSELLIESGIPGNSPHGGIEC
jgi:flagellar protein FliO/FliZ